MNMKDFKPAHFNWRCEGDVAVITLKGSERKNPITFESYAELRDTFRRADRYRRHQGRHLRFEWRKFLLGRRCARYHWAVAGTGT